MQPHQTQQKLRVCTVRNHFPFLTRLCGASLSNWSHVEVEYTQRRLGAIWYSVQFVGRIRRSCRFSHGWYARVYVGISSSLSTIFNCVLSSCSSSIKRRRLCGSVGGLPAGDWPCQAGRSQPSLVIQEKKKDESIRLQTNYTGICAIKFYISCELFFRLKTRVRVRVRLRLWVAVEVTHCMMFNVPSSTENPDRLQKKFHFLALAAYISTQH